MALGETGVASKRLAKRIDGARGAPGAIPGQRQPIEERAILRIHLGRPSVPLGGMRHVPARFIQFGQRHERLGRVGLQPRRLDVVPNGLVLPPLGLPRLSPAQCEAMESGPQGHCAAVGLDGRVGVAGSERPSPSAISTRNCSPRFSCWTASAEATASRTRPATANASFIGTIVARAGEAREQIRPVGV